jgi:hypothetical protein
MEVIRELSSTPRLGGSESSHDARDYIAGLLDSLGLAVRLQPFTYVGWEYEEWPELEVVSPIRENIECAPVAFSEASGGVIEGRVWEDGKVIPIPELFEFVRLAVGDDRTRRASILVQPTDGPAWPLPNVSRNFQEPTAHVSKADGERILAMLRRGEDVKVALRTFGRHRPGAQDANVVARLEGESDEIVVVGGHYDSAWLCPGAIDNATGVAAMVEVARRAVERGVRRTFEFVAFAAEEWWLFGSEYFVLEAVRGGKIGDYKAMINCDPLGPGDTLECWVGPERFRGTVDRVFAELGVFDKYPVLYRDPKSGSDHYPFWLEGVPVVFPIFIPHPPEYHRSTDVIEAVRPEKVAAIIDILDAVASAVDRPGSEYGR